MSLLKDAGSTNPSGVTIRGCKEVLHPPPYLEEFVDKVKFVSVIYLFFSFLSVQRT